MNLLVNFLLTTGIVLTLTIIFVLIRRKGKTLPHHILIAIFSLFFFVSFYSYGELNAIEFIYASGFIFTDSIGFLIGPLLYLYIKSIYLKKEAIFPFAFWHFVPAILYILFISIPFLISTREDDFLFSYVAFLGQNEIILQIQVFYLLTYTMLSLLLLKKFKIVAKENFSNLSRKDLEWIKYLLYGIIGIVAINISVEIYSLAFHGRLSFDNTLTTIGMILVVIYLGYYGTSQSRILLPDYLAEKSGLTSKKESNHHLANATKVEIADLESRLLEVLKHEKPYENELLNLEMLAKLIPTTDRKLSALLNHKMNIPFYDLINSYRVEAVKAKMAQNEFDKYTLLALAYDAGFNSKSSFNRIFKKHTNFSPSAFKEHLKKLTN